MVFILAMFACSTPSVDDGTDQLETTPPPESLDTFLENAETVACEIGGGPDTNDLQMWLVDTASQLRMVINVDGELTEVLSKGGQRNRVHTIGFGTGRAILEQYVDPPSPMCDEMGVAWDWPADDSQTWSAIGGGVEIHYIASDADAPSTAGRLDIMSDAIEFPGFDLEDISLHGVDATSEIP